jgi:GNAT superfamily N-acetyltransferase
MAEVRAGGDRGLDLAGRLERHLAAWLGAWPPAPGELLVVGSARRTTPGWDGKVYPVVGVSTPDGTVLSVPPDLVAPTRAAGGDMAAVAAAVPALVGRPDARFGRGVFRWCHELVEGDPWRLTPPLSGGHSPAPGPEAVWPEAVWPEAVWLAPDDERVPPWLAVFNGEVLVHLDEHGRYGAGVGRKRHDDWGQELSVATEEHLRGKGLARRLVAQAARRVADEGAVATYLHAISNIASAKVAEASGFPDTGWWILGLPVAS